MKTIRIFISSPGDVSQERERAREVVDSLRRRYTKRFNLKALFWEDLPLQSDMSFQSGIDTVISNKGVDIAVFILWTRLGSPLGALIRKPDGSEYRSGTEREYDLMLRAREQTREREGHARPALLVYTRRDDVSFGEILRSARGTSEQMKLIEQKQLVEEFLAETFKDSVTGTNIGAYFPFDRPTTFSQRLRVHLQGLLDEMAGDLDEVIWDIEKQGPPFLGLEAFQTRHADIFFGREEEILEARRALKSKAGEGCAFLLISGASGSGKSSLARAGLLPEIVQNEVGGNLVGWLQLVVTPSELGHDPLAGLVSRLGSDELLPDLQVQVGSLDELARDLARDPEMAFRHTIRKALDDLGRKRGGEVRLIILLDQFEELFTGAVKNEAISAFLNFIEILARSGSAWIVATARSDFYERLQKEPVLVRMKEGRGLLDLLPPGPDAIQRLIEEPARLAGLSFELNDQVSLASRLLRDSADHAELLPVIEFVLLELYGRRDDDNRINYSAYREMGGIEGAIARKAEETYASLPLEAQGGLDRVLTKLVMFTESVSAEDSETLLRRYAPLGEFEGHPEDVRLVDALVEARLFTSTERDGRAVVSIAHEALLRAWPRAVVWKKENSDFLRLRARVELRLREGVPMLGGDLLLEEAKAAVAGRPEGFSQEQLEFISECLKEAEEALKRREMIRRLIIGSLSILTVLALTGARWALEERDKTLVQLERSQLEEGRAWLERAKLAWEGEKNPLKALMLAGRAVGFHGFGRGEGEESTFADLLGREMDDSVAEAERVKEVEELEHFLKGVKPVFLPIWLSPIRAIHQGKILSVSFSPDGTRLASASGDKTVKLWDMATGAEVATLEGHSDSVFGVSFSPDGTRLASASWDKTVKLWDVATGNEVATLEGHSDRVFGISFSPNGRRLASGSGDKTVKLWDVVTGKEVATLEGHSDSVFGISFSPDGTRLASASEDKTVKLWDVATGKVVATLEGHSRVVESVSFSPNGRRLASGSMDKTVKLWDVATGNEVATLEGHSDLVGSVSFSPDGTRLASASWDKTVKLWDMATGKEVATLEGHSERVNGVSFSPDGTRLASASEDKTVKVWDVAAGSEVAPQGGHSEWVTGVSFSPDGTRLASASGDKTVKLWDVTTGNEVATLEGHSDRVTSVSFSPDGTRLASGSRDKIVKLWDVATGKEVATLEGHSDSVFGVSFSPDGTRLASASWDKTVKLWDVATGNEVATLEGHSDSVFGISFSPDGTRLASASGDKTVKLWDVATGKEVATLEGHSDSVFGISFSPDGTQLASASGDKTVKLWDVATGKVVATLEGHSRVVKSVSFSPDGARLASGSEDKTVKLWDVATGKEVASTITQSDRITSVSFSPDGTRLASGSWNNTVAIWDVAASKDISTLMGRSERVMRVSFSPDGTRLASGSWDKAVKVWDVATKKEVADLEGHSDRVESVSFSPDGRRLASGSDDKTVRLWAVNTGNEVATLSGHSETVFDVSFSPDGTRLASASGDKTVKLWDVATGKEVATLEGHSCAVYSVWFNPDGTRLASESVNRTVKFWDVATGKEVTDELDSAFASASSLNPYGRLILGPDGYVTLLESAKSRDNPNLFDLIDDKIVSLVGRDVELTSRSQSIYHARKFAPRPYHDDELTALSMSDMTPAATNGLHLHLMGRTCQWRAARAWWLSEGSIDYPALRNNYLVMLLVCAGNAKATLLETALADLTAEISANLMPESVEDLRVSLALSEHLLRVTRSEQCPDPVREAFLAKVSECTTRPWQEGVALRLVNARNVKDTPEPIRERLAEGIQHFASRNPDSPALLRAAIATREPADPPRLADEDRLLALPESTPEDFTEAAYVAAQRNDQARAGSLFAAAEARFPNEESVHRMKGWTYLKLNDPVASIHSFEAARDSLHSDEKPGTELLSGLAIAQWLNGQKDEAIATYRQLIKTDRAEEEPTDWVDPKTIADLKLREYETVPLTQVRAATLERHPELILKANGSGDDATR